MLGKKRIQIKKLLICAAILALLSLCAPSAMAKCRDGLRSLELKVGEPPKLGEHVNLCSSDFWSEASTRGVRYIVEKGNPLVGLNDTSFLELVSESHEVIHLISGGLYWGEFIDRQLSDRGLSQKDTFLTLAGMPNSDDKSRDITSYRYWYEVRDYKWSVTHVIKERIARRVVRLDTEGSIQPVGDWERMVANRRIAVLRFTVAKGEGRRRVEDLEFDFDRAKFFVEVYSVDPYTKKEHFFRRFKIRSKEQKTVLRFLRKKDSRIVHPVILKLFRGKKTLKTFKISDPLNDETVLDINLSG